MKVYVLKCRTQGQVSICSYESFRLELKIIVLKQQFRFIFILPTKNEIVQFIEVNECIKVQSTLKQPENNILKC